jgi:hypothetical protein
VLLQAKTAAVFAATGAIGSAVARRFAAEGARVLVSGRSESALQQLGKEIGAPWRLVDALDESQVSGYVDEMAVIRREDTFTLAPWRPALQPFRGQAVAGIIGPNRVSWTLDRGRGLPPRG